jgi:hypothetical protein
MFCSEKRLLEDNFLVLVVDDLSQSAVFKGAIMATIIIHYYNYQSINVPPYVAKNPLC